MDNKFSSLLSGKLGQVNERETSRGCAFLCLRNFAKLITANGFQLPLSPTCWALGLLAPPPFQSTPIGRDTHVRRRRLLGMRQSVHVLHSHSLQSSRLAHAQSARWSLMRPHLRAEPPKSADIDNGLLQLDAASLHISPPECVPLWPLDRLVGLSSCHQSCLDLSG